MRQGRLNPILQGVSFTGRESMQRTGPAGPLLASLVSAGASAGEIAFADVTQAAGVAGEHNPSATFVISQINIATMTAGGAAGDFDRDGDQDLFVLIGGGGPDRLFINQGDGTFVDQAAAWGIAAAHMGLGVAVGDYDRDGWLDIYVTSVGPGANFPAPNRHRLYRNTGSGSFSEVAQQAGVRMTSPTLPDGFGAAFGDYDLDGDLDLFVTAWVYHSNGNRLFRNNGNGTFTDVTVVTGVHDLEVRGFSPLFADMDGDRFPELLVAADFESSRYYVNNGNGTLTDMTVPSGTGLDANGMGHAIADFDGDASPDWYVTSIYTPSSQLPAVPGTGNMLYMSTGRHAFAEQSLAAGVKDGGWGWGTVAVDIDHDGLVDLIETNGWAQPNFGQPEWVNEQCYVWRNQGNGTFQEIAKTCGFDHTLMGRGMLRMDHDLDGDQDIVVFSYDDDIALFRNDTAQPGGFLRLDFDTSANPRLAPDGYGTLVVARAATTETRGWMTGGSHYLSQSELTVHLGLDAVEILDELEIQWTSGVVTVLSGVAVNQVLTLVAPPPEDLTGDALVNVLDLTALILAWGQPGGPADVNGDGAIDVLDLIALLLAWD
jgi:hypothetical protein